MMRNTTSHESYYSSSPMIITNPTLFHLSSHSNYLVSGTTSSCSSSSCSASINQGAQAPVTTFCWGDYLLSDPVSPVGSQTQVVGSSATSNLTFAQKENFNRQAESSSKNIATKASGTCHSVSSFVDAMLDKDQEMLSQFPQLLNDFDY